MIDLHTHSIHSDGDLIPSELVRRAMIVGYRAMALTDHCDHSNMDLILPGIVKVCKKLTESYNLPILPGIELTHVPPEYIHELVQEARGKGAMIIIVHGETIAEPVMEGTNLAALQAPIDILAHPGLIGAEEATMASRNGICLEITTRKGHSLTNGHIATMARKYNFPLVLNTDSHGSGDLTHKEMAVKIARGAGMTEEEIVAMFKNSENLIKKNIKGT
ncbi:MAG: DNA polymerase/3'-5' exonuclease PolX [Syntrophus sp. PtaB.Bin001]|nr:MAG: DNA polymerase/3'-5' exonuclease PolX [Syntrophus sp. PtaB.Bin001]